MTSRGIAPAIAALIVIALCAAGPLAASASAADAANPPRPFPAPGMDDMLGSGWGPDAAAQRARPPVDGSGAFVYRRGRFTPLARIPGAGASIHYALNNRGEVAGVYVDDGAVIGPDGSYPVDAVHGFVKDRRGAVTRFDVPGGFNAFPQGMNDRGQVAGIYLDAAGVQTGFVRDRSAAVTTISLSPIGTKARDINDHGDVVGIYGEPAENELGYVVRGYLRDPRGEITTIEIPGTAETDPYAINDRNQIAGTYLDAGATFNPDGSVPPGTLHGFLRDKHGVTRLDVPGSLLTVALDVDNRGRVAGGYIDAAGRQHAFLWTRGRYTVIDAPRPLDSRAMGNIATAINDRGELVIPEPDVALVTPAQ
jgi:hypothetical protein